MHVYSAWLQTGASRDKIGRFAETVGEPRAVRHRFPNFPVLFRAVTFSDEQNTEWASLLIEGTCTVAVAELPTEERPIGGRVVGVIAPTIALTADLFRNLEDFLANDLAERVYFPLRQLFSAEAYKLGIEPVSVRLRNDSGMSVLLKGRDGEFLRQSLEEFPGTIAGVTVIAGDQRATVLENGQVVFPEDATFAGILSAMQSIDAAAPSAAPAME